MNDDKKYGVPEQKKFPMPDAAHVRSAIRFFNYVEPRYEKKLAKAILARMKEYGLTFDDFTIGEENRFSKYIPKDELMHYGILGMHWGVRRYQNEDGTLTEAGKKHYAKLDDRWADRNADKIQRKAYKKSQREMKRIEKKLRKEYDSRGRQYMNAYNQNLARVMSTKVTDLSTPSGKAVRFVAKRGEYGVFFAMASKNYDMNKVKNGVWGSGRVAYKNTVLNKSERNSK